MTDNQAAEESKPMSIWMIVIIIVVVILIVALIIMSFVSQFKRYSLIGDAINSGQHSTALALSSPEIGTGIGNIFQSASP